MAKSKSDNQDFMKKTLNGFNKWIMKNKKGIFNHVESMRECVLSFKLHQHSNFNSYLLAEMKSFKRLESRSVRETIRRIIASEGQRHLLAILRLEIGLIKSVCKTQSYRRKPKHGD